MLIFCILSHRSYNQLVNELVECNSSDHPLPEESSSLPTGGGGVVTAEAPDPVERKIRGAAIQKFLDETASQFTYFGLISLYQTVRER